MKQQQFSKLYSSEKIARFNTLKNQYSPMTKNPKTKTQQDQNDKKANFHFIRSPSGVSNGMNLNIGSSSSHRFTPTSELLKNYKGSLIEPQTEKHQFFEMKSNSFVEQVPQISGKGLKKQIFNVTLKYKSQKFHFAVDSQDNTTKLFDILFQQIFKWEQSNSNPLKDETQQELSQITHFQTTQEQKNLSIDYYLSQPDRPLQSFKGLFIYLEPFFSKSVNKALTLDDFIIVKCIGVGGFSRVYLVRKKDSGYFYAMKIVDKRFILENKKEIVVQNERNILKNVDNPFLTTLYYSFETYHYLVFIMEYCSGGELFFHLRKLKRLNDDIAKFYFVQICLALKYLHQTGILYRDIKPENILLDMDGYLQLSDFGLSKPNMNEDEYAYSFCGSPEYMAPEMLLKNGHNYMVDCYCLGALLYEFVTGLPPFYSRDTQTIYNSILSETIKFPSSCRASSDLKDLIRRLLEKNPSQRMGKINGIDDILKHPWLKNYQIDQLQQKKIDPQYKPSLLEYNFDEEEFGKGDSEFQYEMRKNLNRERTLVTSIQQPFQQNNDKRYQIFPDFYFEREEKQNKFKQIINNILQQPSKGQGLLKKNHIFNNCSSVPHMNFDMKNSQSKITNLFPKNPKRDSQNQLKVTKGFKSETDLKKFLTTQGVQFQKQKDLHMKTQNQIPKQVIQMDNNGRLKTESENEKQNYSSLIQKLKTQK